MTTTLPKIFGQKKPAAATDTNLFSVATGHQAQLGIFVCNQSSNADNFTIALIPNGLSESTSSYIAYNTPVIGNGVFSVSGISLNSGDKVNILSVNGTSSFTASGLDIGP